MRKDTKKIVVNSFNDLLGGLYNSFLDGILEEDDIYDDLNTIEKMVDWVYQDAVSYKKEIKFDGTENIKHFIRERIEKDEDILEALDFLKNKNI